MNNIAILQEILQYIDAHIKEKMNVEILADRAGFSPYYFCRMFQSSVGTSIMEYVRNRRLAYAASELSSGRKLQDIAVDYGFETHSGFSKAFRRVFGSPPEIFRSYASFNVPKIQDLTKSYQFEDGKIINPKIMARKKAFKIAGYTQEAIFIAGDKSLDEIAKFIKNCKADGRLKKLHDESFIKHPAEYGVAVFKDYEVANFVYVIGLEIKLKSKNIPAEYFIFSIPESMYAVFSTTMTAMTIDDTWQYILTEWLPNSGYEFDTNGVPFEFFDGHSSSIGDQVCDIYVPIVNRQL